MTAKAKSRDLVTRAADGRLLVHLGGPNSGAHAEISIVPDNNGEFSKMSYVWVGTSATCFGHLSTKKFLALADALRARLR